MNKQCCGTCALWDRDAAKDKMGRVRRDRAARCLWESLEIYPESVNVENMQPLPRYTMLRDYGEDCKCWAPRT